ncbi:unnamed protein product [Paramecium octaurelia]|uniref:Uncharacterized protein n=1 Tax=Paramecium octaurelia TaxID=43137 RepID=A0A8S1VDU6_PAROT|nr:unnamed protein product [Paramecium octaurelia]
MMESKSTGTKRLISVGSLSNYERAEFISSKTDTKQRLGELFIYEPTKLEMFGLRQQIVSTRIPRFEHPKPMFELDSQPDKTLTHVASQTECQKCNHSMGKIVQPKLNMESLHLSAPSLQPYEKQEPKVIVPKQLQSHVVRQKKKDLPPMLQYSFIQPPPVFTQSAKAVREQKSFGKLSQGRISKKYDNEMVKVIQQELSQQLHKIEDEISDKGYSVPIKYSNLKRTKQMTLSKKIKQEKQSQILNEKKTESQFFMQKEKEKEIRTIVFLKQPEKSQSQIRLQKEENSNIIFGYSNRKEEQA